MHAQRDRIYLANHSLGRPLDATEDDVREGLAAWYARLGDAWDDWGAEMAAFRARLAALARSAARRIASCRRRARGRACAQCSIRCDRVPRVVATRGEFDSLDVILREYARRGRVDARVRRAGRGRRCSRRRTCCAAIAPGADLVVLSQVMFQTGQVHAGAAADRRCRACGGARVLLDVYHSLGVFPVDLAALDVDFAVGGSYKYLRGGPGACFLYVAPRHLDAGTGTLDIGWFAKESPFAYARPDPPRYAAGGDAWLESTPAVLAAVPGARRAGVHAGGRRGAAARVFARAAAAARRAARRARNRRAAAARRTAARSSSCARATASAWADALEARGIVTDARGEWLRLCPDVLTTETELRRRGRRHSPKSRAA